MVKGGKGGWGEGRREGVDGEGGGGGREWMVREVGGGSGW